MSTKLFSTFKLRDLEFRNRIVVSPMCQYSAVDGVPNDWHLVHLGSRAVGGAALVMVEATGINAVGDGDEVGATSGEKDGKVFHGNVSSSLRRS